eukprot:g16893.t1
MKIGMKAALGLPLRLLGRQLPAPKHRRKEDSLVAVAWGLESCLFLVTRSGSLGVTSCDTSSGSLGAGAGTWREMGRRAFALAWAPAFAGPLRVGPAGLLALGLAGRVEILDAADMTRPSRRAVAPPDAADHPLDARVFGKWPSGGGCGLRQ